MKKAIGFFISIVLIVLTVSCNNIYNSLASIGDALQGTGTNVFGLDAKKAKEVADAATSTIFGKDSEGETSASGLIKTDTTNAAISAIFTNKDGEYKPNIPSGLKDPTENDKLDYNLAVDTYLKNFMLSDEDFESLLDSVSEIKSDASRKAFAENMATKFYKDGDEQPIPPSSVKKAVEDFKEVINDLNHPSITKFVFAVLDASIDDDGNLKKAGALMISATATVVDKVFTKGAEIQGVPRGQFDFDELSKEQSIELIKYAVKDVKNLHTILLTSVGYDSDAGKSITDLIMGIFAI